MKKRKKEWYLNIYFWILLSIILVAIFPTIANLFLKYVLGADPSYSLGDAMEYYGAVIGFIGTVALGIIALYQNYSFKNENDRLMQLQNAPYFSFVKIDNFNLIGETKDSMDEINKITYVMTENNTKLIKLDFDLKNISDYPIINLSFKGQVFDVNEKKWISLIQNQKNKNIVIEAASSERQSIAFTPIWFDNICQAAFPKCSRNVFGILVGFTNTFGLETYGRIIVYKDGRDVSYRMLPLGMFDKHSNKDDVDI